ncbi:protein kinase [Hamiltosporidium tvaerminnensis]|uniref:Protein kinase n=1 Tax=Hamiltosporidium tvaerminnensis TaxID=1176355 RepID=A0A4Q9M252_9MICR|nr:protein kinase [Hamiltosporidium tvaerminnensis]
MNEIILITLLIQIYCTSNSYHAISKENKEERKQVQIKEIVTILYEEYYIDIKFIIEGGYGKIFRARHLSHPNFVALKVYTDEFFSFNDIMKEISFLENLNHPNIISGKLFCNNYFYYLEMDFYEFDLFRYVRAFFLSINDKKMILKQVLDALFYLKSNNVIHNDLKNNNILIDKKLNIKICDFGFACKKENLIFPLKKFSLSILEKFEFYSPEFKKSIEYDEKSDIYSFGILVYFIFNEINYKFETYKPITDTESHNMFLKCKELDPKNRPSADSLLLSRYFDFLYEEMFCFGKLKDFIIETGFCSIIKHDKTLGINIKNKATVDVYCCCHILTSPLYISMSKELNLKENCRSANNNSFNQITTKRFLYVESDGIFKPIQFMPQLDRIEYLDFFYRNKKYQAECEISN